MALSLFTSLPSVNSMNWKLEKPRHPLPRTFHRTRINLRVTACSVSLKKSHEESKRRSANYQPTTWSSDFLQSLKNDYADNIYKDKAMELEEEVRCMINSGDMEMLTILEMIDDIQRLGLGHRFEKDIKRKLDRISSSEQSSFEAEKSLHATALCFRLLRQHGYEWADLCKAFLQEAKWSSNSITPSFEEYLENAWRSVSGTVILIHAYFLLGGNVSKQSLDYLVNYDELLRWPSIIFRLCNDLATSSAEIDRGETANSISCYMYETGVSEAEARKHVEKLIQKAWRNMNKYQMDSETPFARRFVAAAINLARIAECTYQHGDGHGAPDSRSKNRISSLIIEPISFH
ncbi:hypothetical protein OIU77_002900 [Salix suchowensis]|uniref:Terpene synthase metal-binding domain-containing protein n=1 Tax=Salix suchowensis TaxID=1278906 RepID=A0ABQ9AXT4_9ROSI|nr:hypothetical protein OIU77_002900 [Salix suchowensis]